MREKPSKAQERGRSELSDTFGMQDWSTVRRQRCVSMESEGFTYSVRAVYVG